MIPYLKLYLLTIPVFLIIDLLWLGVVAEQFYQQKLAHLLSPQVNWRAAFAFYFIYNAGVVLFAVRPALIARSLRLAAGRGALYGFVTYATYDLTNLATLADWPVVVAIVDIVWGAALGALVASASYLIGRKLGLPESR